MDICDRDIQVCHHLKDKDQTIVNCTNKDCLRIPDPAAVDLPEETKIFVNESLCPYCQGIWNKCKKVKDTQKVHQ